MLRQDNEICSETLDWRICLRVGQLDILVVKTICESGWHLVWEDFEGEGKDRMLDYVTLRQSLFIIGEGIVAKTDDLVERMNISKFENLKLEDLDSIGKIYI